MESAEVRGVGGEFAPEALKRRDADAFAEGANGSGFGEAEGVRVNGVPEGGFVGAELLESDLGGGGDGFLGNGFVDNEGVVEVKENGADHAIFDFRFWILDCPLGDAEEVTGCLASLGFRLAGAFQNRAGMEFRVLLGRGAAAPEPRPVRGQLHGLCRAARRANRLAGPTGGSKFVDCVCPGEGASFPHGCTRYSHWTGGSGGVDRSVFYRPIQRAGQPAESL